MKFRRNGLFCLLVLFLIGVLCSCGTPKEPKTVDEFIAFFDNGDLNFHVEDITNQYTEDYVDNVILAVNLEHEYQIEFFDLSEDSVAKNVFNVNKENINNTITENSGEVSYSVNNVERFSKKDSSVYYTVARIGDTVIYSSSPAEYTEELNSIIKDLGY